MKHVEEQLANEWKRLSHQWQISSDLWRDQLRYRFEREFMHAYAPEVEAVLKEMQQLGSLISKARTEVR